MTRECPKCQKPVSKNGLRCALCHQEWHQRCALERRPAKQHAKMQDCWECADCAFREMPSARDGVGAAMEPRHLQPQQYSGDADDGRTLSAHPEAQFVEQPDAVVYKYNELSHKTERLTLEVKHLKQENNFQRNEMRRLRMGQECQRQSSLKLNVELHGVEQRPNERVRELVLRAAHLLGVAMGERDLLYCERLPSSSPDRHPYIVATLKDLGVKRALLTHRKTRTISSRDLVEGGDGNEQVFINEHLTPYFRRLLWATKKVARQRGFQQVWYRKYRVFARKPECFRDFVVVQSLDDLQENFPEIDMQKMYGLRGFEEAALRQRGHVGVGAPRQGGARAGPSKYCGGTC